MTRPFRALVYGDVNMNVIDGSSVWLQSTCMTLAGVGRAWVTLQLKERRRRLLLLEPLDSSPRVSVLDPPATFDRPLRPVEAGGRVAELARDGDYDAVIIRGLEVALNVAADPVLLGRLWCYLTDFPHDAQRLTAGDVERLNVVAEASRVLLCQTQELRSYLETYIAGARGKTHILPPMVPGGPGVRPPALDHHVPHRIVYAGKYSLLWRTEELARVIPAVRRHVPGAELVMAGDKVHREPSDPQFAERMQVALQRIDGVRWRGSMSREATQDLISTAQIGVSLREPQLDDSLEHSTKILEYGRAGVPPVLSRTPMHERLLGTDYPFFLESEDTLSERLVEVLQADSGTYERARNAAWSVACRHTYRAVSEQLEVLIDRVCPDPAVVLTEPRNILIAGHDLRFAGPIAEHLAALPGVRVRLEQWPTASDHDEGVSEQNLGWADAVFAEWCAGAAVWYSRYRQPGQRVVVRTHRFERDTEFPDWLEPDGVDHMSFVSFHVRRSLEERVRAPPDRLSVLPNAVPRSGLQRPKLDGTQFNLGLIGFSPMNKRLDLALEILRRLRAEDRRFFLFCRGHLPIDQPTVWADRVERAYFERHARAIQTDPLLRESVLFEPYGFMPEWFRKVGIVLSLSDEEGSHVALEEGMASGCLPIVRPWPGSAEVFPEVPPDLFVADVDEAAERILRAVTGGELSGWRSAATDACGDHYLTAVCAAWERLLLSPEPPGSPADRTSVRYAS